MTTILSYRDYQRSSLYKILIESDEEDDIVEEFKKKFYEKNISTDEIKQLLDDYTKIKITKENVYKYLDLICFFGFDIINDFIEYIIINYYYQLDLYLDLKNIGP